MIMGNPETKLRVSRKIKIDRELYKERIPED